MQIQAIHPSFNGNLNIDKCMKWDLSMKTFEDLDKLEKIIATKNYDIKISKRKSVGYDMLVTHENGTKLDFKRLPIFPRNNIINSIKKVIKFVDSISFEENYKKVK